MTPSPHRVALPGGFVVSDEPLRLDMEVVHRALEGAYWAVGRRRADTERAFANCVVIGLYAPDGTTAGFARVLTDRTFRAHLADVMVLPAHRGRGLGRALVEAALGHPDLATVHRWTLTTADAAGLYAAYGFRPVVADPQQMVLDRSVPASSGLAAVPSAGAGQI